MSVLSNRNQPTEKQIRDRKERQAPLNAAEAIPPELLVRRDNATRYEKNGPIYATDGRVGVLKKVVVDESTAMVSELVIQAENPTKTVVLPAELVDRSAGAAIFITLNRVQFEERVTNLPEYDRGQFGKADLKALLHRKDAGGHATTPRRSVTSLGADYVETPSGSPLERLRHRPPMTAAAAD